MFLLRQEKDIIQLKRRVNEEWLEGEIDGRTGIFPANFVRIEVPLDGTEDNGFHETTMITLFNYEAQTWDDLDLKVSEIRPLLNEFVFPYRVK